MKRLVLFLCALLTFQAPSQAIMRHQGPHKGVMVSAAAVSAVFLLDTFTESATEPNLFDHTPETGAWGNGADEDSGKIFVNDTSDEIELADSLADYFFFPATTPPSDSYTVLWSGKMGNASATFDVFPRYSVADTGLQFRITGGGAWSVTKHVTGTPTLLSSGTVSSVVGAFATSTYYDVLVTVPASNVISLKINGLTAWANSEATGDGTADVFFAARNTNLRITSMTITNL